VAITLTTHLKLRVDSGLTDDAKFNLYRIDDLGSLYKVDANSTSRIRSKADIVLQPQDLSIGGTGEGGSISLGTIDYPADLVQLNAADIRITGQISSVSNVITSESYILTNNNYNLTLSAPTLPNNVTFTLPDNTGANDQVLTTDGNGILSWASIGGTDVGAETVVDWDAVDGTTKTITHNLGTRLIIVQVLDTQDNYKNIDVDVVERPTLNTVVLTASMAPTLCWKVLIKEIRP
jgi:hypothetical protein